MDDFDNHHSAWYNWFASSKMAEAMGWWTMWGIFACLAISVIISYLYFFRRGMVLGEYLRRRENEELDY